MMRFAAAMNISLAGAMVYARTLEDGIMAAAWFWEANGVNAKADTPGVADKTRVVNGGSNGLQDHLERFERTVAETPH